MNISILRNRHKDYFHNIDMPLDIAFENMPPE